MRRSRRCQQRRAWKKRRKALARSMRRVGHHMNRSNQPVWQFWGTSGETVWIPRGSLAATLEKCRKSTWGNGASDLESQATQHGLPQPASFEPLPRGVNNLLGLDLNYCIKTDTSTKTTANTFERFRNDVRWTYKFHVNPPVLEAKYMPKLYTKSGFKFNPATDEIENALIKFECAILEEQKQCQ